MREKALNLLGLMRKANAVQIGETVDVFIHRLFIIDGDKITLADNQSLKRESVII